MLSLVTYDYHQLIVIITFRHTNLNLIRSKYNMQKILKLVRIIIFMSFLWINKLSYLLKDKDYQTRKIEEEKEENLAMCQLQDTNLDKVNKF